MAHTRDEIEGWILRGMEALLAFYEPKFHCFSRDSLLDEGSIDGEVTSRAFPPSTGATSSNRAFAACAEFLYFLAEERKSSRSWESSRVSTAEIVQEMINKYFSQDIGKLRRHSQNGMNMFTDAHVLASLSAATGASLAPLSLKRASKVESARQALRDAIVSDLEVYGGGRIHELQGNNELVTLYCIRAVESADLVVGDNGALSVGLIAELRRQARADVLRQLGLHSARDPEFDTGSLLAGILILHRYAYRPARRLVLRAVEIICESQEKDGSWRADLLTLGRRRLVYVSSIEMANLLACLALADVGRGSLKIATLTADALEQSFANLEAGYTDNSRVPNSTTVLDAGLPSGRRLVTYQGWANDQAKQLGVVESWSTAIAVQLLLRLHRLQQAVDQLQILQQFRWKQPASMSHFRWTDLDGVMRAERRYLPSSLEPGGDALDRTCDPSNGSRIKLGLRRDLIEPILTSPLKRPNGFASFLLFGPPGTRKTSLVRAVADSLEWPLVTLSPPDFLVAGIEGLERRAGEIFTELMRLRRVVILFDECEEFFRRRLPVEAPEHRTQGAFITAGMLPRLQELRDCEWTAFAIVTNTELDELDPAVVRRGRLDKKQRVGYPQLEAQKAYLIELLAQARGRSLSRTDQEIVGSVLDDYDLFLATDTGRLSVTRTWLMEMRNDAIAKRKKTGDLRRYFEDVNKARSMEAELPLVTFEALEQVAKSVSWPIRKTPLRDALSSICSGREPDAWAVT